jgi:eukaryotic-like serine/threonine-protein kinase
MPQMLERTGSVLAERYVLERELGRGGMATVYLGRDLRQSRQVAVKVLRPELASILGPERFLREIGFVSRLTHPHILPLHDSGDAGGLLYYVMPYVEGESLRERLQRDGRLPLEEAVRIAAEVGEALDFAHTQGIVHRDVKPGNILLEDGHAVVADFGIAKAISTAGSLETSSSGLAIGTPGYMSPEQIVASGPIDGRADLYSLACVVYEMLAGHPPFVAASVQAVAARHLHHVPPSLCEALPSLPESVDQAIQTALKKEPEQRFATAAAFIEALGGQHVLLHRRRPALRRTLVAAAILAATAAIGAGLALRRPALPLDPGRIVVYPVAAAASARSAAAAPDEVTLALLASLNSTATITGLDGARLAGKAWLSDGGDEAARGRLARVHRAAFYVSARLLAADSLHLVLDLHDLREESVTQRVLGFTSGAKGWSMGVRAALELLPMLIPSGDQPDLRSLEGRTPQAMAAYFSGERAYRSAAFEEALRHFRVAVRADSSFALAALRGAAVASWSERPLEALEMARLAVRHEATLPPRLVHLTHGLEHLMAGQADSAAGRFDRALALDPENVEAWMGLAETYHHLLPRRPRLDSLAEDAYLRVRRLDPQFAPATFHLIEYAVRRGDVAESSRLLDEFGMRRPDSAELGPARLMLDCVRGTMTTDRWRSAAARSPGDVRAAGQLLAVAGLRQPDCAEAAFRAVLAFDTTRGPQMARNRFGVLTGLQSVLVARGRAAAAKALLESDTLFNPGYRGDLYLMNAMAGSDFAAEADSFAKIQLDRFRREPSSVITIDLWFLGSWEAHAGRAEVAAEIAESLQARNAVAGNRRDSLLLASLAARVTLARGDSAAALQQLRALAPTTEDGSALTWNPWESLGGERLILARLLLARGENLAALQTASNFDAPTPMTFLPYLPASLALRLEAAERLGLKKLADELRRRQAVLAGHSPVRVARNDHTLQGGTDATTQEAVQGKIPAGRQ